MEPDFSQLFHQSSKDHAKGHPPIDRDSSKWPEAWSTVYYKAYHRLPKIPLPNVSPTADLFTTIEQRVSRREYRDEPLSLEALGSLLRYSCGNMGMMPDGKRRHRAQASGGARYPIEVYPFVLRAGDGYRPGLYHYNVKAHALDVLWERTFSPEELDTLFMYDWTKNAGVVFLMTAVFRRNQMKYGERGYRYILIEAGHIGQNLYLVSGALGLQCCALGGARDEMAVERLLDIDGVRESLVYLVAIGH